MVKVKVNTITCQKCQYTWIPRTSEIRMCPKCKNVNFDRPRKVKVNKDESNK